MRYFLVNNVLTLTIIFLITTGIPRFVHEFTSVYFLILRTEHTFGQLGLITTLFILTTLAYKKYGWALFILGIQYGIHAAWALWSTLLVIAFIYFDRKGMQSKVIFKYALSLLAGSIVTLTIFTFHIFRLPNSSYDFQDESNNLIEIYLKFWDYHRNRPFDLNSILWSLALVVLLLLLANLTKRDFPQLSNLNTIVGFSSLISTILYLLNDGLLNNSFVPLSLLMPGRFMNLHALCSLPLFIININYLMSWANRKFIFSKNYLLVISKTFFPPLFVLYIYLFTGYLQKIPFRLDDTVVNVYNSKAEYCEILNQDNKRILTSGISSRFIPINCKRSIILDSSTIDFIPYLPKGVVELKNLTEQLYGIDFNDPRVNFQIAGKDFARSGAIPPEVIKPVWEMRTLSDWNLLACIYDFSNIVTPSNYEINLPIIFNDNHVTIFEVNSKCNKVAMPAISVSGLIEFTTTKQPFFWVPGSKTYINVFNNTKSKFSKNLSFDFIPNSCNSPIKSDLKIGTLSQNNVTITDQIVNMSIPINLEIDESILVTISVEPLSSNCFVAGDTREFTVGLSNIIFSN